MKKTFFKFGTCEEYVERKERLADVKIGIFLSVL